MRIRYGSVVGVGDGGTPGIRRGVFVGGGGGARTHWGQGH